MASLRTIINEVRANVVAPIATAVTAVGGPPAVAPMGAWDEKVFRENTSAHVLAARFLVADVTAAGLAGAAGAQVASQAAVAAAQRAVAAAANPAPAAVLAEARAAEVAVRAAEAARVAAAAGPPPVAVVVPAVQQAAALAAANKLLKVAIENPGPVTRVSALAAVLNNLDLRGVPGAASNGDVVILLADIFDKNLVVSKSGKLIFNLPKSDELVNRLLSVAYARSRGMDVQPTARRAEGPLRAALHDGPYAVAAMATVTASRAANRDDLVTLAAGTLYNSMPASDRDQYKSLLAITPAEQTALDKWDERVEKIREVLSQGAGSLSAGIDAANIVRQPELNNISQISSLPSTLKQALLLKRASDPSNPVAGLTRLRVSMNGGDVDMRGGNANPHAPFYPRVVMNGGAHPLATYMGGAAPDIEAPVKALMDRITGLREQFRSSTGGPSNFTAATTLSQLDTYKDSVRDGLNSLQENLDRFAKLNAAVSRYRPGLGVDVNAMDDQQLKDLVKQADDLNKQAQKSAKQFDKLKEISELLQQLVDKQNAAPVAR